MKINKAIRNVAMVATTMFVALVAGLGVMTSISSTAQSAAATTLPGGPVHKPMQFYQYCYLYGRHNPFNPHSTSPYPPYHLSCFNNLQACQNSFQTAHENHIAKTTCRLHLLPGPPAHQ